MLLNLRYLFSGHSKLFPNVTKIIKYSSCTNLKEDLSQNNDILTSKRNVINLDFNDPRFSQVMLKVKSKKLRTQSNLISFEGKRVLKEAMNAGVIPEMVFFSRLIDLEGFEFSDKTKLYKISYNDIKTWSSLKTPPGLLAVCQKPESVPINKPDIPVTVICDNIREPGNLGALLRNSAGVGVRDVILIKGCVDIWDDKVIRGGSGTQFRIPMHNNVDWSDMNKYLKNDTLLLIADNNPYSKDVSIKNEISVKTYCQPDYSGYSNIAIVIGGETEGVSDDALNLMKYYESKHITIPLSNNIDSLNSVSALSIILFEIKRQLVFSK